MNVIILIQGKRFAAEKGKGFNFKVVKASIFVKATDSKMMWMHSCRETTRGPIDK